MVEEISPNPEPESVSGCYLFESLWRPVLDIMNQTGSSIGLLATIDLTVSGPAL